MFELNFKPLGNQIALFFILLGINIILFSFFTTTTASLLFGSGNLHSAGALRYINSLTQIGIFGLTAFEFAFFVNNKKPLNYLQLNTGTTGLSCFYLIVIAIVSLPALSYIIEWNEGIKLPQFMSSIETWMREKEDATAEISSIMLAGDSVSILLMNLLVMGVIAALCEELFFRGLMIKWFKNQFKNIHLAVFLSAFIFSAFHLQFYGFIPRLLLGLYLGYLFIWTGSLWPSIIAHFINNGMIVVTSYLHNNHLINVEYSDFGNVGSNYILIGISIFLTATCIYLLYREQKKPPQKEFLQ